MKWTDVAIGIPTMPERSALLATLLGQVSANCHGAEVVAREHEPGTKPRVDLPLLVDLLVAKQKPWTLILEDDVWLAPGFGEAALDAIGLGDANLAAVSLFSRSRRDMELLAKGERWRAQPPSSFCMMQAVFVRTHVLHGFAEWAPFWYEAHPEHIHAADLLLGAWLSSQRARMIVHIPSLVQHRAVPSTLPGRGGPRQSATYRAAFGEVP